MRSILHVMVASPAARIPSWQAERQTRPAEKASKNAGRVCLRLVDLADLADLADVADLAAFGDYWWNFSGT
jgi:hypothetical protein